MPIPKKPGVNKLLRVLVAGGVALSGAAGLARADDQPAPDKKMEKSEKGDAKEPMAKSEHEKHHEKDAKKADEKKAEKTEKTDSDGGGVKGW